jgi:hypothetical protein
MSSVLLIEIRVPNYHGDADTLITAEWQKMRGNVVRVTGRPDLVYSDAENAIGSALRAARRAAMGALQP